MLHVTDTFTHSNRDKPLKNAIPGTFSAKLYCIAKIRKVLSLQDAEKLIHAFITSQLDYCNAVQM